MAHYPCEPSLSVEPILSGPLMGSERTVLVHCCILLIESQLKLVLILNKYGDFYINFTNHRNRDKSLCTKVLNAY